MPRSWHCYLRELTRPSFNFRGSGARDYVCSVRGTFHLMASQATKLCCSLGSHKMKASALTTYAVPATALSILLTLARYIPCIYAERSRQCCVNYYAQQLLRSSCVLLICARERLVSAHLSRFSGKDGNPLQGCCSQQYEEGDILGCSCLRRVETGA